MERISLTDDTFERLSQLVKNQMGIKMPPTKKALLESRLQKRVRELGFGSFTEYCDFLLSRKPGDEEIVRFCDAVATNKTDFFRENTHFEFLRDSLLPELFARGCRKIRIWSAASSSGEEPYTLAMVLEEFCADKSGLDYSVLGTDISTKVLARAKAGVYKPETVEGIPANLRNKYLKKIDRDGHEAYEIIPRLKNKMKWGRFNLMTRNYNVPGPFEIIFCRNVLIYFDRDNQKYIFGRLLEQLTAGGTVFLGHSESMAGMNLSTRTLAPSVFRAG